jgi:hypothetical protein
MKNICINCKNKFDGMSRLQQYCKKCYLLLRKNKEPINSKNNERRVKNGK